MEAERMGTDLDQDSGDAPQFAGLETITGGENLLILVAAPCDELSRAAA